MAEMSRQLFVVAEQTLSSVSKMYTLANPST